MLEALIIYLTIKLISHFYVDYLVPKENGNERYN